MKISRARRPRTRAGWRGTASPAPGGGVPARRHRGVGAGRGPGPAARRGAGTGGAQPQAGGGRGRRGQAAGADGAALGSHRAAGRLGHRAPREDAAGPPGREGLGSPVELSGGLRKRVSIARRCSPGQISCLLDEPTNHLDADTTEWLEDELDKLPGAVLLVTHDRYFLDGLVDRIVEINPGQGVKSYPATTRPTWSRSWSRRRRARSPSTSASGGSPRRWPGCGAVPRRGAPKQGAHRKGAQADGREGHAQGRGAADGVRPRLGHTIAEAKQVPSASATARCCAAWTSCSSAESAWASWGPTAWKTTFLHPAR